MRDPSEPYRPPARRSVDEHPPEFGAAGEVRLLRRTAVAVWLWLLTWCVSGVFGPWLYRRSQPIFALVWLFVVLTPFVVPVVTAAGMVVGLCRWKSRPAVRSATVALGLMFVVWFFLFVRLMTC